MGVSEQKKYRIYKYLRTCSRCTSWSTQQIPATQ